MAIFIFNARAKILHTVNVCLNSIKTVMQNNDLTKKIITRAGKRKSGRIICAAAALALAVLAMTALAGLEIQNHSPERKNPVAEYRSPEGPAKKIEPKRGDVVLMARVIEGEAADEPFEGKVAVGAVIVNRVESGKFPGDVRQVVYQPLAFEAVENGQINRPLTGDSIKAAEKAVEGSDPTGGSLYYWNPQTAQSQWVWQRPVVTRIGRHVFAR